MTTADAAAPVAGTPTAAAAPTRRLRADARRNRDRVLEAARVAFAAEGSEASLDEIARRAGVGAGTVYRHFATKEALFEAVVIDRIGELVDEARDLAEDPDPGRAFASFVGSLAREGALKRDLVETLARDGIHLQLAGAAGCPGARRRPGRSAPSRPARWRRATRCRRRRRDGPRDRDGRGHLQLAGG